VHATDGDEQAVSDEVYRPSRDRRAKPICQQALWHEYLEASDQHAHRQETHRDSGQRENHGIFNADKSTPTGHRIIPSYVNFDTRNGYLNRCELQSFGPPT
jgi:hypothetical protein